MVGWFLPISDSQRLRYGNSRDICCEPLLILFSSFCRLRRCVAWSGPRSAMTSALENYINRILWRPPLRPGPWRGPRSTGQGRRRRGRGQDRLAVGPSGHNAARVRGLRIRNPPILRLVLEPAAARRGPRRLLILTLKRDYSKLFPVLEVICPSLLFP